MDSATSLYRSVMRPFRDRPDIKIPGRWYWCPEGAKALPFAHAFLSYRQDSSTTEGLEYELGELPEWHGLNTHVANSRYTGQHWCGTEEDWQKGAIYGQAVLLDAEGVPVCCQGPPLRPGGGAIVIKTPVFSLSQAIWWLNPDTLPGTPFETAVDSWVSSAGPPNDAIISGPIPTIRGENGIPLYQNPPHGARNSLVPTNRFSLHQCSWYFVGGGRGTIATHNGPTMLGGILPIAASFVDNLTGVAVSTNHHIANHSWHAPAVFGLFSCQFDANGLFVNLNGTVLAGSPVGTHDVFRVDGFQIADNHVPIFAGAGTGFGEFILFDRVLTPLEDFTVLSYLAKKFQISLGPDPIFFPGSYFPQAYFPRFFWPWKKTMGEASEFFHRGFFPATFFVPEFFP